MSTMQTLLLSRQIQHLRHSKKISSQSHNKEEDGINYRESVIGMHEKMEGGKHRSCHGITVISRLLEIGKIHFEELLALDI